MSIRVINHKVLKVQVHRLLLVLLPEYSLICSWMSSLKVMIMTLEANFLQALLRTRFNDLSESHLKFRLLNVDIFAALRETFVPYLIFAQLFELL